MNGKNGKAMKLLSVIIGTLAGGFLWRCRGESGWGSSWGLYSVGLILLLLIWQFYGRKKGMKYEMLPVGALLAGLGVTGYGTVIEQMSGLLTSDLPYQGPQPVLLPIDPYSGMIIILFMGVTLIPLFSFFVASLFSEKEYKIRHYLIAIAVFFVIGYIAKATVAHPILKLINPEQVNYAALGLKDAGFDFASPYEAYMRHFAQRAWTQDIPFFENYYMSVEHISDVFGILGMCFYALVFLKDKLTCFVSLIIDLFTGISTTALSSMIVVCYDTGLFGDTVCPRALENGAGWGIWEFATGAAVGFVIMLIIALLPGKYTAQTVCDESPLFDNSKLNSLFVFAETVFVFGVVPARVVGIRIGKLLKNIGVLEDGNTLGTILTIVFSVMLGVLLLLLLRKHKLFEGGRPFGKTSLGFAFTACPAYLAMCCIAYFCLNHGVIFFLPYAKMTSFSAAVYELTGPENIATTVMLITFVLLMIFYLPVRKKLMRLSSDTEQ